MNYVLAGTRISVQYFIWLKSKTVKIYSAVKRGFGGSVVVDFLFIVTPITLWESVIVQCFVVRYFMSILYCNHLDGEERISCFA